MIRNAVVYSSTILESVVGFESLPRDQQRADVWSSTEVEKTRAAIKSHYISEQKNRCCYCDIRIESENHRLWDVEHIVPRSTHAQFMFVPLNLAVACPDCNGEKAEMQTLVNPARVTYPASSTDFKVIHPHFDEFSDHIYRVGHVYIPKTRKGNFTIRACNLLRFAEKYIDWANAISDDRFEAEVGTVLGEGPGADAALRRILEKLT
jgi:uncharacterized protein (TIGR02646 family)